MKTPRAVTNLWHAKALRKLALGPVCNVGLLDRHHPESFMNYPG